MAMISGTEMETTRTNVIDIDRLAVTTSEGLSPERPLDVSF